MNITKADTLPESWIKTTLGNISILRGQYGLGASSVDFQTGKPRYIRITDIDNNGELNNEIKSPAGNAEEWKDYFLDEGDLLFARSGATVGKTYLHKKSDEAFVFAGYLIRFKINQEIADPLFIFYFSKTSFYSNWVSSIQTVAAQPNVNASSYGSLKIPLPPLAEQKQIVAILQEADALRRKKKEILEKSNRLASALFLEMFGDPVRNEKGWDVKKLEEFGKIITGNTPPRENPKNYNDNYIEWIKTDNINNDNIFIAKAKEYLSKEGALIGRVLEPGAVLVTCIAGSLNSIGSVAITDRKVAFNQQINAIQPFENVNSLYILSLIKLSKTSIQSHAKNALKNIISKSVFSNIKFILPPLHLQNDFAKKVEAIEDTTKQIESSLQKMEKLYDSLLQKAFTGNLWFDKLTMTKVS
jgi:type I restriction enzyme S subunit